MNRSTDVTSFTAHRRNLRDHLNQIRATARPLFVTTNGETDAVVLSPEAFDELAEKVELAESLMMLDRGMEEVAEGKVRPLGEAVRKIAADLDLKLPG